MKNYSGIKGLIKRLSYRYDNDLTINTTDELYLHWWNGRINLGDVVNKFIAEKLSSKKVNWCSTKSDQPHFLMIGSILQSCNDKSIVWGSGIISDEKTPLFKPKKVCAVRGPKTRNVLIARGIDCPEIYGDPALILPILLQPKTKEKKFKLGIVPHYNNKNHAFFNQKFPEYVKIIDIETDDIQKFVDEIAACEMIVSSSLHGIIISDAYGIPAHHISFDDTVMGGTFKFFDYYLSVERECVYPLKVDKLTPLETLISLPKGYQINIDIEPLLKSCPLKD